MAILDEVPTGAVSIAHLAGIAPTSLSAMLPGTPAPRAADPSGPNDKKVEEEEVAKPKADDEDGKKARRAKKAKKRDDDDDGDDDADNEDEDEEEDMKASSVTGRARMRERARCAAIFAAAKASGVDGAATLAQHFAFATGMQRGQAIGALKAALAALPQQAAKPARASLDARMAAAAIPAVGADEGQGGEGGAAAAGDSKALADRIIAIHEKARGAVRK